MHLSTLSIISLAASALAAAGSAADPVVAGMLLARQNDGKKNGQGQKKNNNNGNGGNKNGGNGGNNGGGGGGGAAAAPPARVSNDEFAKKVSDALATTLQKQISDFNAARAIVEGKTNNQFTDNNGGEGSDVDQDGTELDASLVQVGSFVDGQSSPGADAGQVASLTSQNNFINFCATQKIPLCNGLQFRGQACCNPTPWGAIPSTDKTPTAMFFNPRNGAKLKSQTPINFQLKITNMAFGNFANAQASYASAPQQLDGQGKIFGHTHIVVTQLSSLDSTDPPPATDFIFFKGVNTPDFNGKVTGASTGLPNGFFRACSMVSATNHQPIGVNVAQRVNQDDCVRFEVADDGDAQANVGDADSAKQTADFAKAAANAFAAKQPAEDPNDANESGNAQDSNNGNNGGNSNDDEKDDDASKESNAGASNGNGSGNGNNGSGRQNNNSDGKSDKKQNSRRDCPTAQAARHRRRLERRSARQSRHYGSYDSLA